MIKRTKFYDVDTNIHIYMYIYIYTCSDIRSIFNLAWVGDIFTMGALFRIVFIEDVTYSIPAVLF